MSRSAFAAAALSAVVLLTSFPAHAEPPTAAASGAPAVTQSPIRLDLRTALELAKSRSRARRTGDARASEIESHRAAAGVYPSSNPMLEVAAGPRATTDGVQSAVVEVGISQTFELGPRVSARSRELDALVRKAEAERDAAILDLSGEVAHAFVRALWARDRLASGRAIEELAKQAFEAADRSARAGESKRLERSLARTAWARARLDADLFEAEQTEVLGRLTVLVDLSPSSVVVVGRLEDPLPSPGVRSADLPQVRAYEAEADAARARTALADALDYPDITVGVRYGNEDRGVHTVVGTFGITLPFFENGSGSRAIAKAEEATATLEAGLARSASDAHATAAESASKARTRAISAFEAEATFDLGESLQLVTRSFEAGEIDLAELLVFRKELLETENARIDRQLDARDGEIDALLAKGMLR